MIALESIPIEALQVPSIAILIAFLVIVAAVCLITAYVPRETGRTLKCILGIIDILVFIVSTTLTVLGMCKKFPAWLQLENPFIVTYTAFWVAAFSVFLLIIIFIAKWIPWICRKQFISIEETYERITRKIKNDCSEKNTKKDKKNLYDFVVKGSLKSITGFLEKTSADDNVTRDWMPAEDSDKKDLVSILNIGKKTLTRYFLLAHFGKNFQKLLAHSVLATYQEAFDKFIRPISSHHPSVPDFFAHSYDDALLRLQMTEQKCTSCYTLKRFFEFYKDSGFSIGENVSYERIFILQTASYNDESLGILKFNQIEDLYNVISLLSKYRFSAKFISSNKAEGIRGRLSYPPERLDFSISKIADNKYLVIS